MKTSVATAFLCIVFGPFGAFCVAWAFIFVERTEFLSAVVAFGFALFTLGLVVMLATVAMRKVTPRVTRDQGGVTVRPDRKVDGYQVASTLGAFVSMAIYAIFAPLDMIDIAVPRGNERYLVIVCAAAVLLGLFSLRQIIRRRGTSYLRMTTDGIEVGNTLTSVERSWDDVADIADRPPKARHRTGTTYITTADGRTRVLPSDWYTPGGHALRESLCFYWRHPEHREELADGRAVERLDAQFRDAK
ncbi:hypothetical protein [Mycobacterium deserti]|uniref:Uncharacterized protein n=1 Tax=Mycobacterium deserti TaxID=2978347 RepID=A0ABT2M601_9MYCO|nr:hypothetical protein [Mycobacterium deserti]MCT7657688.1 hypothetical protein [Mycobacterium deserti]